MVCRKFDESPCRGCDNTNNVEGNGLPSTRASMPIHRRYDSLTTLLTVYIHTEAVPLLGKSSNIKGNTENRYDGLKILTLERGRAEED